VFERERVLFPSFKNKSTTRRQPLPPGPVRVLIVDDEEPVRRFVERVMAHGRYQTMTAPGGDEAIEIATKHGPFDLLLTDLLMPKMNGDELARQLRQQQPSLKVLYLTGYSDRLFREKVNLWEGEAFLDKPCTVKSLLQAASLLIFGRFTEPPQEVTAGATG
jgi:two-component system, cell cycle sensor histidine kinase and response regulator CckA